MTADFNTEITINGTGEELLSALDVLETYNTSHFCDEERDIEARLDYVEVCFAGKSVRLVDLSEEERNAIKEQGGELYIEAAGPYGHFYDIDETRLFENLADAAPESEFSGIVSGFKGSVDEAWKAELKEGLLTLKYRQVDEEEECEEDWDDEDYDDNWEDGFDWDADDVVEMTYDPKTKEYIGGNCQSGNITSGKDGSCTDLVESIEKYKYVDSEITSINLPETVKTIGEGAFLDCKKLTDVIMPEGVTDIGRCAFEGCESLKSIVIPNGVNEIKEATFSGCSKLCSVVLPDTIKKIGANAFLDCENLKRITLPSSLESIEYRAFGNCHALVLENKDSIVAEIQRDVFSGCESMQDENGLLIVGGVLYAYYGKDKKVIIPEGVSKISTDAFATGDTILEMTLSDTVVEILSCAFCGCCNLKTIYIPESVNSIEDAPFEPKMFEFCPNLTIKTQPGSYAEQYAREHGIPVEMV